jgi:hypothetical protein
MKVDILQLAQKYEIQSTGTASDPIIFDYIDFSDLPLLARIRDSDIHIQFDSCIFNSLRIEKSENIIFKYCEVKHLTMNKCLNINIENSEFVSGLRLESCYNLKILNSRVDLLRFFGCFENLFKNCTISTTLNNFSRGNVFENTHFLKGDEYNLVHGGKKPPFLFAIIALISVFIFAFALLARYANEFGLMELIMFIITFIIVTIVTFYMIFHSMKTYRKSKKYPPNKIV